MGFVVPGAISVARGSIFAAVRIGVRVNGGSALRLREESI